MNKPVMDCASEEATYSSLAGITGVDVPVIRGVVCRDYPGERNGDEGSLAQLRRVPGFDEREHSTCWFHVTRASRTNTFGAGLLPLGSALEGIWKFLRSLLDESGQKRLDTFRPALESDRGSNYARKVEHRDGWGPHGLLVRETAFRAAEIGNHDYLQVPEIIEDICAPFRANFGIDLLERYWAATEPCIVKFITSSSHRLSVETALAYLRRLCRDEPFSLSCNLCFNAGGSPIERDRILGIEFLS